ncbi:MULTISPECIES: hypothetical protein [unclassified Pseudomonas]|uniref:hypothetical protein n=1 Tax=unclassified Pseudomonas TaxID=196821 RepID=UPI000C880516|nr:MULTISPECIES: hypothetical protein [unclassified Pseudomonas]PMZ97612.1 hypothetical protein C1X28_28720 [Pseudomonas sp. FW305-BF15]PNB77377.1 hypothetical protein C1X30_28835 [Pseudomonas sp. FW305-BF6]
MKGLLIPERMKRASVWVVWGFVSIGVLGWGLWVVLKAVGSTEGMTAWVQALGSIGAILAAVAIAQRGVSQQKEDKLFEGYDYMQKAYGVAVYASEVIVGASDYILEGAPTIPMLKYHSNLLEIALEDLKEIEYVRLDDSKVADAFLSLKRNVNLTRSAIQMRFEANEGFDARQVAAWGPYATSEVKKMSDAMIRYLGRHPNLLDEVHALQQGGST